MNKPTILHYASYILGLIIEIFVVLPIMLNALLFVGIAKFFKYIADNLMEVNVAILKLGHKGKFHFIDIKIKDEARE